MCIRDRACEDEVSDADTIEALAKGSFERSSWKRPKNEDGTEPSPFGDLTWNQWVEQVRKKYQE